MKRKLAVTTTFLILFWGVFVSCQSDAPTVEPTGTAVSPPQVELAMETAVTSTSPSTNPPTNTPTLEPSLTATATLPPTPTAIATATATVTAVPTPSYSLTQREPELVEIEEFLSLSPVLFFYPDRGVELISLNDYFFENDLTEYTEVFYEDVNGDGENDLILADMFPFVWSNGFVVISLWNGNQYNTPLVVMDGAKYQPGLQVSFEDWTNDAVPEVIFDFRADTGGTGFIEYTWKRFVIHCQTSCNVAWWGLTGQLSKYNSTIGLTTREIERKVNESDDPMITIIDESFYAPDRSGFGTISGSYRVFTSTMTVYTWNGSLFEQTDEQIIAPEEMDRIDSVLSATSEEGKPATITSEFDDSDMLKPIFICTLQIDNLILDENFECLPDYTRLFWQDIANDGKEELVVLATGLGTQQLLAFEVNEQEVVQVANVTGDIIRSDLFGVRLEDVDGDGQLEILAGRGHLTEETDCKIYEDIYPDPWEFCWWNELNLWEEIYRWDGGRFVPDSSNSQFALNGR